MHYVHLSILQNFLMIVSIPYENCWRSIATSVLQDHRIKSL